MLLLLLLEGGGGGGEEEEEEEEETNIAQLYLIQLSFILCLHHTVNKGSNPNTQYNEQALCVHTTTLKTLKKQHSAQTHSAIIPSVSATYSQLTLLKVY